MSEMTDLEDVLINIRLKMLGEKELMSAARRTISNLSNVMSKAKASMFTAADVRSGGVTQEFADKHNNAIKRNMATLQKYKDVATGVYNGASESASKYGVNLEKTRIKQSKVKNELAKTTRAFAGWAMSLMFAGMAIQRVFKSMLSNSQSLNAGMTLLKQSIGAALEPVGIALMPIIAAFSEWAIANQQLVQVLTVLGFIFGSLVMWVGMGKLAFDGFAMAFAKIGVLAKGLGLVLSGIGVGGILLLIGAIILFATAWKLNLGNIQEYFKTTFENIKNFFKGVFDGLKKIFSGFVLIIQGIFEGSWEKIGEGLKLVFLGALQVIWEAIKLLVAAIYNAFVFVINFVGGLLTGLFKLILDGIQWLIDGIPLGAIMDKLGLDLGEWADTISAPKVSYLNSNDIGKNIEAMFTINVDLDGEKVGEATATKINQFL